MARIPRNLPCPCGSRIKYKNCHGRSSPKRPMEMQSVITKFREEQNRPRCFFADESDSGCSADIVQAHTVAKSQLRRIAKAGRVFRITIDPGEIWGRNRGILKPQVVGIATASTFAGFCAEHDRILFSDIENMPLKASAWHAALLALRIAAKELHAKEGVSNVLKELRGVLPRFERCNEVACVETRTRFERIKEQVAVQNPKDIRYVAIWISQIPQFMYANGFNPEWDFNGERLQVKSNLDRQLQGMFMTLLASQEKGIAYFAWDRHDDEVCIQFLRSLLSIRPDLVPNALVRLAFSTSENIYWNIDWWNQLESGIQENLILRFQSAADPTCSVPPWYLSDDEAHAVNWRITEIESNVDVLNPE